VKHKFVGGVYHTPLTIFEKLDQIDFILEKRTDIFHFVPLLILNPIFPKEIFLRVQICCSGMQSISL